jgi:hypothetical protein
MLKINLIRTLLLLIPLASAGKLVPRYVCRTPKVRMYPPCLIERLYCISIVCIHAIKLSKMLFIVKDYPSSLD